MDKKKSILNVFTAIFFKVLILLFSILAKRYLISLAGNTANGLNSLYLSIIGILSITELGIGSAIAFCMYEPIVNNQQKKVSALYNLFTKLYRIVGSIIMIVGLMIMPALPFLAKGYISNSSMYISYLLMLISVVLSYMFSSKISLINAHKNNYITTTITSSCVIFQHILQIVALFIFRTFEAYLWCRIIAITIQWGITEIYTRKHYKELIETKEKIDDETKEKVAKNIKAMFMHKVGSLLVNTIDSLIISAFIGVIILGKYSNYVTIASGMTGLLCLIFTSLTSVVGHLCAKENIDIQKKYFNFFFTMNFLIGVIFFLGFYAVVDDLVKICFGDGLKMEKGIVFVTTINYFVQYMRQSVLLFRDATGLFYNDRWKPLIEGISNLILSIILVNIIGVMGVILATIITNLFICDIVEPYILYKNAFKETPKKYFLVNYLYIVIFIALTMIINQFMISFDNAYMGVFVNGMISLVGSISICLCVLILNKQFRTKFFKYVSMFYDGLTRKIKKHK